MSDSNPCSSSVRDHSNKHCSFELLAAQTAVKIDQISVCFVSLFAGGGTYRPGDLHARFRHAFLVNF